MARKVFVSSDISVDDRLIDVACRNENAALMWPWFLTAFDDWGRCDASPKRLKAQVFPSFANITPDQVTLAVDLYCETGLVVRYTVNGKSYLSIPPEKWFRYQTHIHSSKRTQDNSKHPAPPCVSTSAFVVPQSDESCASLSSTENRGTPRDFTPSPSPTPSPTPSLSTLQTNLDVQDNHTSYSTAFEDYWSAYPRKVGKRPAYKAWRAQQNKGNSITTMLRAAQNYAVVVQGTEDRYIMHASTFLGSSERWRDYIDPRPAPPPMSVGIKSIIQLVNDAREGKVTYDS